jgi:lipopolysaccharide export system protein LptC
LDAGKMTMTSDPQSGDVHLFFTNGVKLIYDPGN